MSRNRISLVEVGLRDGLQNESINLSVETRLTIARQLAKAGARRIEIGAFVRADRVPQMAGSKELIALSRQAQKTGEISKSVRFSALVPNERGMLDAVESQISEVAIFGSSSESFSIKNINCTIEESFERFVPVVALAKKNRIRVRGYLSTCFGCPYEGKVSEAKVIELATRLWKLGCYEISIGDTIGVANPMQVTSLFKKLKKKIPVKYLAGHFHDTRGTALTNILAAYQVGVRTFDTSLGGLGGCPYAPGASGNVATEDVVYLFESMKVSTGHDLAQLIAVNEFASLQMGKKLPSKVGQAKLFQPLGKVRA